LQISFKCSDGKRIREEVFRMAAKKKWGLRELREEKRNLEDVFVEKTVAG